jgi:glycolate oxidase FAD binding subunit
MTGLAFAREALQDQILQAKAHSQVLSIRGLGSKDFYRALPLDREIKPLSTSELKGIINYEPTELFIQVASGTSLRQVEALLDAQGQCLPFEPPRLKLHAADALDQGDATIGGMVASGLSGPARASVGGVRDFVLGANLINGKAEHLVFGGQVMKNVAGYDVSRLLAGSMGTLGLITELTLKVLPKTLGECSLKTQLSSGQALALMQKLGQRPLPLNASSWLASGSSTDAHGSSGKVDMVLRLKGAKAATQSALASIQSDLLASGLRSEVLSALEAQAHWNSLRDQTHSFLTTSTRVDASLWRISLPLKALKQGPPSFAIKALSEWFGALHWVWADAVQASAIQKEVLRLGGTLTLWRAAQGHEHDPVLKGLNSGVEAHVMQLQNHLQRAFDPGGVFNTSRAHA